MKNSKRLLCIALSLTVMMIMGAASVFAAEPATDENTAVGEPEVTAAEAIDINSADVTVDSIPDQQYDAAWIAQHMDGYQPEPVVKYQGNLLVKGTDYNVVWENNIAPTHRAEVIITGINKDGSGFSGTRTQLFTIVMKDSDRQSISGAEVEGITDKWYTGQPVVQDKLDVEVDEQDLDLEDDYTVTYSDQIGSPAQDTVVTMTITGVNEYKDSITRTFTIWKDKPYIEPVKNLKAIAGYQAIKLTWDPVEGADTYYIMRNDKTWETGGDGIHCWPRNIRFLYDNNQNWATFSKNPHWENKNAGTVDEFKTYKYTVYAVKNAASVSTIKAQDSTDISEPVTIKKKCVSQLRITVKSKQSVTLKSISGGKHYHVSNGEKIVTTGYGAGKYSFYKKIGKKKYKFRIMNVRVRAIKTDYQKKKDYTVEEAEYFINSPRLKYAKPGSTKKSYLVWASLYTQHVYGFQKKNGKWVCKEHWDCSSGGANSPSPTGNCKIEKRIEWRHHTHYWNCFSTLNALHGIKPARYAGYNWVKWLGQLKSNGCIRNNNSDAKWIWTHCGKGTKVLVR